MGGRGEGGEPSPRPSPIRMGEGGREDEERPPPSAERGHLPGKPGGGEKTWLAEDGQAMAP